MCNTAAHMTSIPTHVHWNVCPRVTFAQTANPCNPLKTWLFIQIIFPPHSQGQQRGSRCCLQNIKGWLIWLLATHKHTDLRALFIYMNSQISQPLNEYVKPIPALLVVLESVKYCMLYKLHPIMKVKTCDTFIVQKRYLRTGFNHLYLSFEDPSHKLECHITFSPP